MWCISAKDYRKLYFINKQENLLKKLEEMVKDNSNPHQYGYYYYYYFI